MKNNYLKRGDVLRVYRGLYYHYGVYVGNGRVVHFCSTGMNELDSSSADIVETSFARFSKGDDVSVDNRYVARYSSEEVVERAKKMIGTQMGKYDLYGNNCEHFANWCKTGETMSYQSRRISSLLKEFSTTLGGLAYAFEEIRSEIEKTCYDNVLAGKNTRNELGLISILDLLG